MSVSEKLPSPDVHALIDREEWDFSDVPDGELVVCRLWEYARESQRIRTLCEQTWEAAHGRMRDTPAGEVVRKEFSDLFKHLKRQSILFQEGIYSFRGRLPDDFHTPFPTPWQKLTIDQRRVLCATASWKFRDTAGIPFFRRAHWSHAEALAQFKPEPIETFFDTDPVWIREFLHSGDKLRRTCPNYVYENGTEVLTIEIDWGKATNEELIAAFSEWLRENSPPGIKRPDGRGRKRTDLRAALDWLGMMRLLHLFTRAEMASKVPAAAKRFASRDWYRDRKRANATFRELFHFLPAEERPLRWRTKGSRNS